jgi:hypothetical protein
MHIFTAQHHKLPDMSMDFAYRTTSPSYILEGNIYHLLQGIASNITTLLEFYHEMDNERREMHLKDDPLKPRVCSQHTTSIVQ